MRFLRCKVTYVAWQFVREFMKTIDPKLKGLLRFVDTRHSPTLREPFVDDSEPLQAEFASHADCQRWMLQHGMHMRELDWRVLFIADKRSAEDGTLSFQFFPPSEKPTNVWVNYGPLPPVTRTWYEWRIEHTDWEEAVGSMTFNPPDMVDPVYYGMKDELTDERGVFNVTEAMDLQLDEARHGKVVFLEEIGPNL